MKRSIILLAIIAGAALAQSPPMPPLSLRVAAAELDPSIVAVPVIRTNFGFGETLVAYWYSPPYVIRTNASASPWNGQTNATVWIVESSTNGINWNPAGNHGANLPPRAQRALGRPCLDCLNWTEIPTNDPNWQVRIRRVPWL